jgi:hypothetical protein
LTTTSPTLPLDAERTTISEQRNFVWCHGSRPAVASNASPSTLSALITENDHWAVRSLDCPNEGVAIAQALLRGTAIALCDGSYKDHFGTAGFVLQQGSQREQRIVGANVTPGHSDDQNPYRAEIGGIFAIIVVVDALVQKYQLDTGTIEIGCDCASGITSIFEHDYDTPSQPHHDLIHEIHQKIKVSPITWKFRHVPGHQDKYIPFHLLDLWCQLNVEMDTLAKTYWNATHSTIRSFYPRNSFGWSLWIDSCKLSNWDRSELYNHANSSDILQHWSNRRVIPPELIHSID